MKIIKSRLIGARVVRAREANIQLFQIRAIFNQHRDALVNRILTDLGTYMEFKFSVQPSRNELIEIAQKIDQLKSKDVDLEYYQPLLKELKRKDEIKIKNEYFFLEIDESIRMNLTTHLHFAA
ncbi:MAG: hypothetical protein IM606_01350 [Cytophagales bacterium]|jgi:hypothetical protein|nr:hypothetical protein [Cytophagales bacterium]MCA6387648.1 hypothetical protein [Cytophagales bacterium]MCA6392111.1 hypothetical protein [Cytophagales bacterium]MCA6393810.1 hypothetical protein [Cytophagales bacterium]MCA6399672.1 hypothetical protein [Cytophagales bacterium]